ncbi:MAG TPA: response regulator transcription factor [Patescibacteria group bacterium]|nr:response regulator transcription factor [Patescibacteria group bacterium]
MKILLVEDEEKLASFVKQGLQEQSYIVDVAYDGLDGKNKALKNRYDLIIVDLMLPKKSGFALCKAIRAYDSDVMILILTALESTRDKIQAFESGADDYLTKPFDFRELLLRIRALFRRKTTRETGGNLLQISDLELDPVGKIVKRGGKRIELTAKEFTLLEYLLLNQNRVVSRVDILENVWETDFDPQSNTVEVYINFLRRKIDKNFTSKLIHTVIGMGYVLREDG